jgi:hypothetical protein
MSGSLPFVRGTAQALYPVTRRVEFMTDVAMALNSTEQRFKKRPPLTRFVLPYSRITATDTASFRSFFNSQKGTFDSTWTFTLGTTTYIGMTFEDDTFTASQTWDSPIEYAFTLRARQTQNPGQTAGSSGGSYPTLANGTTTQFPYSRIDRFQVLLNDNPIGPRYSWTWFENGLTGFPTTGLRAWTLGYPLLSDADLITLETFYRSQWGCWGAFTFTDPDDHTVHSKCRFQDDVLQIVHNAPNQNALTLRIMETN